MDRARSHTQAVPHPLAAVEQDLLQDHLRRLLGRGFCAFLVAGGGLSGDRFCCIQVHHEATGRCFEWRGDFAGLGPEDLRQIADGIVTQCRPRVAGRRTQASLTSLNSPLWAAFPQGSPGPRLNARQFLP